MGNFSWPCLNFFWPIAIANKVSSWMHELLVSCACWMRAQLKNCSFAKSTSMISSSVVLSDLHPNHRAVGHQSLPNKKNDWVKISIARRGTNLWGILLLKRCCCCYCCRFDTRPISGKMLFWPRSRRGNWIIWSNAADVIRHENELICGEWVREREREREREQAR